MKTAVIGGSGYAGGELLRLLAVHPHFQVVVVTAHSNSGELITAVHPQLTSYGTRTFSAVSDVDFSAVELVFIALPHGESASLVHTLPDHLKIVDLGADFRLVDSALWEKYYGGTHAGTWVYGLPEIIGSRSKIAKSKRIANPGCYPTSVAIGLAPALDFIDSSDIVVVSATGTTGAGRNAKVHLIASEIMGSLNSYKFGGVHQHTPEMEQTLSSLMGATVNILFTPIMAPMTRGILSTLTAKMTKNLTTEQVHSLYSSAYQDEYFVDVLAIGQLPKTGALTGSNKVQLQVAVDSHTNRLVVSVALDNLGKGAAGQAIQNANIINGFPEASGLSLDGLGI